MARRHRLFLIAVSVLVATPASACEPVVPFMQVMVPAQALSGSILVLTIAVLIKSALFAVFERRLPPVRAAWRMFLGNVLTSFVGLVVAVMIATSLVSWLFGIPLVGFLCWLPSRRLVKAAPLAWMARSSQTALAVVLTVSFLVSCILFMAGRGALEIRQLVLYWIIKLGAIFLALLASMTLTTVWEEWVIWRLSSRPEGTGFFAPVLRANLYVLLFVMVVPAVLILPKRLKSPDFLAQRHNVVASQTTAAARLGTDR